MLLINYVRIVYLGDYKVEVLIVWIEKIRDCYFFNIDGY